MADYRTQLQPGDPMHEWDLLARYGNNTVQGPVGSGYSGNQLTGFSDKLLSSNLSTDSPWSPPTPDPSASGLGKYMNKDFLGGLGSAMEGLGSLASGWAALKNLKLTRQAMENQQNQWQTNYEAQRLATNNAIANQNAWKQAQGRTDFGSYVGGKPAGSNYVG
jgi:hypothetical protein